MPVNERDADDAACPPGRSHVATSAATMMIAALFFTGMTNAFDELNEAQTLVYDRSHLASTREGEEIVYRYRARIGTVPEVNDVATLSIDGLTDEERRDVTLDFLHDERRLELPPFEGYRGNPVLIAMLEHLAQSIAISAGGGALYVRNRIRDGLAREGTSIEDGRSTYDGAEVDSVTLAFEPFAGDAFLGKNPGYGDVAIRIVFSDAVPGGVLAIAAESGESGEESGDGTGASTLPGLPLEYELRLDDQPDEK